MADIGGFVCTTDVCFQLSLSNVIWAPAEVKLCVCVPIYEHVLLFSCHQFTKILSFDIDMESIVVATILTISLCSLLELLAFRFYQIVCGKALFVRVLCMYCVR